jgi:hypothetical protein
MNTTPFSDFDSWKEHGHKLARVHSQHQFEIANWMLAGEETFGGQNAYDAAEEITGYARLSLQNWVYVARHCSIRIEGLSFGHHQIVAALEPEQQKEWLERAAAEGLSVKKLAAAIQEARAATVETDDAATAGGTAAATPPRCRKHFTPDEQYRYLKFVPYKEADKLGLLALARGTTVEELIVHAIQELNVAAADEIERQRDLEKQKSEASSRRWAECARQDAERRKGWAADKRQAESTAREQAEPDAPAVTTQNKPAPELQADTEFDAGVMALVESRHQSKVSHHAASAGTSLLNRNGSRRSSIKRKTARQDTTGESDLWKRKFEPLINW